MRFSNSLLLINALTGAFAAGDGLSFFSNFSGSALLSTGGAAAAVGGTGGSKVAGFVSDFAANGAIPLNKTNL
ncbi:Os01g0226450 [Oryza sativa Japonica Group]|uniref:Os01g0226450 protein n=1 Tax=Oryza sativa subsp. japonica TaxID=39947 RepID=A0A0P0V036_ORYSJ|nr:hypothetical protein EE612_001185 [Oryza sativa]BAS71119.1 Os01g0226450 [Oryza sativa Japonica Group]